MTDLVIIGVVALILAAAGTYLYRAKKRGVHCVGCPSRSCTQRGGCANCQGGCGQEDT